MRKIFTLFIILLCLKNVKAQTYVTIPDANFATFLQTQIPSAMTGNQMDITSSSVTTYTDLNVYGVGILDLSGVEYFTNLMSLNCSVNSLSILPPLPPTLKTIICDNNQLTTLPSLPAGLINLSCYSNSITVLPALPNSLRTLNCIGNSLTNLPTLPNSLEIIYCSYNNLTNLPSLPIALDSIECIDCGLVGSPLFPNSITHINFNHNALTSLPSLPINIKRLDCYLNQINSLPSLPNSLKYLNCSYNNLISLPTLPLSLRQLDCGNNALTVLPSLPDSIDFLNCSYNQISQLPILPANLSALCCPNNNITCFAPFNNINSLLINNNPFTCLPNYIPAMGADTLIYPLCTPGNVNGCLISDAIVGNTYFDSNLNCIKNAGDVGLKNVPLKIYDNSNFQLGNAYSDTNGKYSFFALTSNTYIIKIDTVNQPFTSNCLYPGLDTTLLVNVLDTNINFALTCKPGLDIGIQSITTTGVIFPGQPHTLNINAGDMSRWYNLNCAAGFSGALSLTISGPVTYIGPAFGALTPSVTGNIFTYNIADFGTLNNTTDFNLVFKTDTTAQAGDNICISATITPIIGDYNPNNNTYNYCYQVVNSYDPNIKEVYPIDVQPGFNDWLTYTIHFQNTGNAPAYNIRLTDTLDTMLDLETFQVINYSHLNNTSVNGNILNVRFPNIMLPDSTNNPSGSIGYIQYRIKPKATWAAPYKIKNTAYIYFDYNTPIVTNSTYNSILVPTGLHNQSNTLTTLYPNPNNGRFTIELNTKEKQSLQLFDITGNVVLSQSIENGKATIDANHLAAGIYNISVKGNSGVTNKKMVIVK